MVMTRSRWGKVENQRSNAAVVKHAKNAFSSIVVGPKVIFKVLASPKFAVGMRSKE